MWNFLSFERSDILDRIIFHIDVNNAFLSWTAVKLLNEGCKIDIREIPSVIGGDEEQRHGIVVAKSPVAKKYNIVTAESLYQARKKCPFLKVFKGDYNYYRERSKELMEYLSNYSPDLEQYSIDECFLDMTGTNYLYDNIIDLAYKIKDEIKEKFGYTVNIGIGNNKLCAKMASDFEKPNKVHTLFNEEVETKMWPLDIADLFMVGKKTTEKLKKLGYNTIYDVAHEKEERLQMLYEQNAVSYFQLLEGRAARVDSQKSAEAMDEEISRGGALLPPVYIERDSRKKAVDMTFLR